MLFFAPDGDENLVINPLLHFCESKYMKVNNIEMVSRTGWTSNGGIRNCCSNYCCSNSL